MSIPKRFVAPWLVMIALAVATSPGRCHAAGAPQPPVPKSKAIVVYVKDMHCAGCAKKISSKLYTVKGVVQVKTDLQKHIAIVMPSQQQQPSLKQIWEAVEAVDFKPVKLVANQQTYTKKPAK